MLRRLEALLAVADLDHSLSFPAREMWWSRRTAFGDWFQAGLCLASARALLAHSELYAEQVVRESLMIAGGIDIYTNQTDCDRIAHALGSACHDDRIDVPHPQCNSPTPRQIVEALDHVIGQQDAKRMVAIAPRNRWRRQQLAPELRDEVMPKNIIMIGPTGVGKQKSLGGWRLAEAPFIKVEASKVYRGRLRRPGRRIIIRDLTEQAIVW